MKIGDKVYVKAEIDEIRKDTIICKNEGGYFGTVESEIVPQLESYKDCISRTDAVEIIRTNTYRGDIIDKFNALPSVKPARAKGRWVYDASRDRTNGHCDRCGHYIRYGEKTNFCPDCGADMEVDD